MSQVLLCQLHAQVMANPVTVLAALVCMWHQHSSPIRLHSCSCGMDLVWSDHACSEAIMCNVSGLAGYAMPGVLTALMGGSGAGKTTLMDVLAGRKTQGITQGELLVNGHSKQQETWARVVGYVEQARTARTAHISWPTTAAWLQTMLGRLL